MQNVGLAQGSRAAVQATQSSKERSRTGPPEPLALAAPPPPQPAGLSCSLCPSGIITKVTGTSGSSPEIIEPLVTGLHLDMELLAAGL